MCGITHGIILLCTFKPKAIVNFKTNLTIVEYSINTKVKTLSKPHKKIVLIFLDTDKHASPFDILTAIDLFPEAQILHYSGVSPDDAKRLIQDAMFPRGPEGAKHTKVFIGGYDVERAVEILEVAKKCMFPPFELAIIVDPRGAYTTASAAVAKTLATSIEKGLGDLDGKTITVLAGTGPVGQAAARLYAMEGANVIVTSRDLARSTAVANKINQELEVQRARGVKAAMPNEVGKSIKEADIILSAGAAGIHLLPLKVLKEYGKRCRVVGDINAIPPLGVEGLKPTDEGVEMLPGVWGIGALAIGTFKNKVEAQLFRRAVEAPKGIFDYKIAYEIAKSMVMAKLKKT
ncbi:MAG: glutamyl-tRNA reductase [Candidatus Bathyarchaeota archaeon BA1]|nr:MAG: glutamyl-tRNA reductase [Candidatus Bathyarchaeota archaeon BA1]